MKKGKCLKWKEGKREVEKTNIGNGVKIDVVA